VRTSFKTLDRACYNTTAKGIITEIFGGPSKTSQLGGSINAGGAQISGRSLLDRHSDHHLDDCISLYHVSNDSVGSIHNIH